MRQIINPSVVVAVAVLLGSALGVGAVIRVGKLHLQKKAIYAEDGRVLRAIPAETRSWIRVGIDKIESPEITQELGTDNYLTRTYREKNPPEGRPARVIDLHAAYYTNMIDTVPHVPERCFTGAGVQIVGGPWLVEIPLDTQDWIPARQLPEGWSEPVFTTRLDNEFSTAGGGRRVHLPTGLTPESPLRLRVTAFSSGGDDRYFAGYFFIANGTPASSAEEVRLRAFDLRNDYAYYLKVQVGSAQANSAEDLAAAAGDLLDELLGEIMTCVPDWPKLARERQSQATGTGPN